MPIAARDDAGVFGSFDYLRRETWLPAHMLVQMLDSALILRLRRSVVVKEVDSQPHRVRAQVDVAGKPRDEYDDDAKPPWAR
jgi:hypothetical protein